MYWLLFQHLLCCCCSVAQPCLTLGNSMDCSTPGLPVHHYHPKLAQFCVRCIGDAIHPSISFSDTLFSSCLWSFPASGTFPLSWLFTSDGQNTQAFTWRANGYVNVKFSYIKQEMSSRLFLIIPKYSSVSVIWWCKQ